MFLYALSKVQGPLTAEKLANMVNTGFTYPGIPDVVGAVTFPGGRLSQLSTAALLRVDPNGSGKLNLVLPFGVYGANFLVNS